jgi:aspartate racemase
MHIGLIVGIGPAATDYYYRTLIAAAARAGHDLELTMAHADTFTLLRNQGDRNETAQVAIYQRLTERLARAGVEKIAVSSIAGHFCIEAFKRVSPVPVIDMLEVVKNEVARRDLRKVGLIGTRVVMETRFYGMLEGVEVIAPGDDLLAVHEAYIAMASAGVVTESQRQVFMKAGHDLTARAGCESVLLAGTDLALVFTNSVNPGFNTLDCAGLHAAAIASAAMEG